MRSNNCHCGLVAIANCVRCGAGTCSDHKRQTERRLRHWHGTYGWGETLAGAAFERGFHLAPRDRFVCKACREKDGANHRQKIIAEARRWPSDPFMRAMTSIAEGYVYTNIGLTRSQIIAEWVSLKRPIETFAYKVLTAPAQPAKKGRWRNTPYRPAQYRTVRGRGWMIPRTVYVFTGYRPVVDTEIWEWQDPTYISVDGAFTPREVSGPHAESQLVIEMARKALDQLGGGHLWKGPGKR